MFFKDYIAAVVSDLRDAILGGDYDQYIDVIGETVNGSIITPGDVWDSDVDQVTKALMIDDGVTGNGSGSYTFNTAKARENITGLLGDPEFLDIVKDNWYQLGPLMADDPEGLDVTARCIALAESDSEVRDAMIERRDDILTGIYDARNYHDVEPLEFIAAGCLDRMEAAEIVGRVDAETHTRPHNTKDSDGFSVEVCDPQTGFSVWVDVWGNEDDVEADFNQYIFDLTNSGHAWRRGFQADVSAFEACTSLAVEAVRNEGYIS